MDESSWMHRIARCLAGLGLAIALGAVAVPAAAQGTPNRNIAPGFTAVPKGEKMLLAPLDVELFSISAGGVLEPRADWTQAAEGFMKGSINANVSGVGLGYSELTADQADQFHEQLSLHGAVARSIAQHHGFGSGPWSLPTKDNKLDWSFGDTLRPMAEKTGARYVLFTWVRDSYASAERKAAMVVAALFGVGLSGGTQLAYATLVDLQDGRVLWFNSVARGSGDLREAEPAKETVSLLLKGLPVAR